MAKIEIIKKETEDSPRSVECLEVLVWGTGGASGQEFAIGSGSNFDAGTNFWIEIRYSIQGLPIFYTRNVVSHAWGDIGPGQLAYLEKFQSDEVQAFGFGDMLPETSITLLRKKYTVKDENDQEQTSCVYSLEVSADMGAVWAHSSPGGRMMDIRLRFIELEDGLRFMRELIQDLEAACQGCHPDPSLLPPGFSEWPLARELNRQAYNEIADGYEEDYFSNPLLAEGFDNWMAQLPACGQVLDAGCGHGIPVIARMLEKDFRITGSDLSPAMLAHARTQFPSVEFLEKAITEIDADGVFDGACSFSSMLYLDQVDFFHSIHRLHRALKPGGLLFLYGYDLHPNWRGLPYHVDLGHWMWGGTRGMEETSRALEEHGYFKVIHARDVFDEKERQEKIIEWQIEQQKEHDKWLQSFPSVQIERTDYSKVTPNLPYPYIVVARKLAR